ncbi:MAG: DUF5011 domain-containing protein [Bacteroidales bacterium]|nr:DUF5011 domain-containing protein [Bacteroidales bacterium]
MKTSALILFCLIILISACKKDGHVPSITLLGNNPAETGKGYPYTDAGATAADQEDGDLTGKIQVTSNVDTGATGTYYVKYNVTDKDGMSAEEVSRTVIVKYFK